MREYQSLSHTRWNCKYHVVFIPKRRRKVMFGQLRKHLGTIFHELAKQKGCEIVEGHLMADHVHMCLSIPPKYAVSNVVGFIKGKSAISIARTFRGKTKNFTGETSGQGASLYQRWVLMKRWFAIISGSRNVKRSVTSS